MSTEDQEPSSEAEEEQEQDNPSIPDQRTLDLLKGITPRQMEKLLAMIPEDEGPKYATLEALQKVAPSFKGNFTDFTLKDSLYKEFMEGGPQRRDEFTNPIIAPVKQIFPRDTEDLRQMDESLTEIARSLLVSAQYLVEALETTSEGMAEEFTEGLFRCLCLTGNAITRLQVERMMHPKMRSRISELADSSQVPSIVKQSRKDKGFFREKAGEPKSPSQDSGSDYESETDPPMRKKKRDFRRYKHKNFRPPRNPPRRWPKPPLGGGRYFKGKRKWAPLRRVQGEGGDPPPRGH
jgi:hypothetical protein